MENRFGGDHTDSRALGRKEGAPERTWAPLCWAGREDRWVEGRESPRIRQGVAPGKRQFLGLIRET